MIGMDNKTGKHIDGQAYLQQRVTNALTTRLGTTVLHRGRGSRIPDLLDAPMTQAWVVDITMACADALSAPLAGVPDFVLQRVQVERIASTGKAILTLTGTIDDDPLQLQLQVN